MVNQYEKLVQSKLFDKSEITVRVLVGESYEYET